LWSVSELTGLERIVIERSSNLRDITSVAEITNLKIQNEVEVAVPSELQNLTRYYRIRIYEKDGSQKISDWKSVESGGNQFLVYPNPSTGHLHLMALSGNSNCHVFLYNALGQLVQEKLFENQCNLQLSHPEGVYRILIYSNVGVEQHSVVLSK
jgi:hypothetical protein